jgi:gluconolactonase
MTAGVPDANWNGPCKPAGRREVVVDATLVASDLGFPEGPVVVPNRGLLFCDGNTGEIRRWHDGNVSGSAHTGGSPWGATLGSDGSLYVTQGGNVPGSGDLSAVCSIQRVLAGSTELLVAAIAGRELGAPNDLAFGPDGRLYCTDSGTEHDSRVAVPSPGRVFALGLSGDGEMLIERPGACPNGIAFDARGRLYWTESLTHRVCRLEDGRAATFAQLPNTHIPDGMAFAADGRLFVCTTISGAVTVVSPDGKITGEIAIGEYPTNCAFDGSALYVTATRTPQLDAGQRTGTLWRVETNATGLPLLSGQLRRSGSFGAPRCG